MDFCWQIVNEMFLFSSLIQFHGVVNEIAVKLLLYCCFSERWNMLEQVNFYLYVCTTIFHLNRNSLEYLSPQLLILLVVFVKFLKQKKYSSLKLKPQNISEYFHVHLIPSPDRHHSHTSINATLITQNNTINYVRLS